METSAIGETGIKDGSGRGEMAEGGCDGGAGAGGGASGEATAGSGDTTGGGTDGGGTDGGAGGAARGGEDGTRNGGESGTGDGSAARRGPATRSMSLSPSRASDFMQCPLLYRFRVIDRLPEKPSAAATRGTLVHAVLEELFDAPAAERTAPRAKSLIPAQWERLRRARPELAELFAEPGTEGGGGDGDGGDGGKNTEHTENTENTEKAENAENTESTENASDPVGTQHTESGAQRTADAADPANSANGGIAAAGKRTAEARLAHWLGEAAELVERWFTLEDPTRLEPAERELFVETELDSGLRLRGIIDRVDVAPTGEVRIVDYKTGKAPRPEYVRDALFQMNFYALVVWRLKGVIPRRLQLVYLGSGDVLTHDPVKADLLAVERKLHALWEAIRLATTTGDWRPRPSRLCGWCDHQAVCPEFGGTPPPYPLPVTKER